MATYKDADGNDVEAFTQAELDIKAKEAADAAAAKAVEDYKAANPTPVVVEKKEETSDPLAGIKQTIESLQSTIRARDVADLARTYAGADAAKQGEFKANFSKLTGFADTPEGLAEQAVAAAKMTGIDVAGVNVGDVAGTGSGRNVDGAATPQATEADKVVQKALGITTEDVKKYGGDTVAKADDNK